jgi:hypothetical protein
MYISFDDGANWKPFQQNLPEVPITDLTIKENDLIVATQGRAIYAIDDLGVLQQSNAAIPAKSLHLFDVNTAYRMPAGGGGRFGGGSMANMGANPMPGVVLNYYVKDVTDSTKAAITILDKNRKPIKTFTTDAKEANAKMDVVKGMNAFSWNLLYPASDPIESMILWNGNPGGILAPPGSYFARIKVGRDSVEAPFVVKADPNYKTTQSEYEQQFTFLKTVQDKFNETQKAIKDIRTLRTQINTFAGLQGKDMPKDVKAMGDSINKRLTAIEETLYQTKAKSGQDVLNYPIRLNDKLSGVFDVANSGNFAPSKQAQEVYTDLSTQINVELAKLESIKKNDIPAFNEAIRQKALPVIGIK